jgi:hypothetical protein
VNGIETTWVIIFAIVVGGVVLLNWADAFEKRGVAKWQSRTPVQPQREEEEEHGERDRTDS